MAKTQWVLLFTTFIVASVSLAIIITSFVTTNWIVAEAANPSITLSSLISYGLFSGLLTRRIFTSGADYELTLVCLYDDGACMYSCQGTHEAREEELRNVLQGLYYPDCNPIPRSSNRYHMTFDEIRNSTTISSEPKVFPSRDGPLSEQYIDAGLWLSTVVFLAVSVTFAFLSAFFAVVNIVWNPIEPILSVVGLYIWNGIASGAVLITLVIWGILYGVGLSDNIAISDTLKPEVDYYSSGLAVLGFSYWILILPLVLHCANAGLLYWRKRIIEAEPPPPTINVDKNDFTIMLY